MITNGDPQTSFAAQRVAIFGGKGGVGKTTCSLAAALSIAVDHPSARVLVISTDPAHSLKRAATGLEMPANLTLHEFDADAAVERFRQENREVLRMFVERGTFFDSVDIDHLLELGLPGMDEAMAFLAILDAANDTTYSHIVVDTPPTGHTLRFLEMPQTFGTWVGFLEVLIQKDRAMRARFSRTTFESPMERFLNQMRDRIERGKALWSDASATRFFAVTAAERLALTETRFLLSALADRNVGLGGVIVNRLPVDDRVDEAWSELEHARLDVGAAPVWIVDEIERGVDPKALDCFWSMSRPLDADLAIGEGGGAHDRELGLVHDPLPAPNDFRLVFFAGKGGVGKTTIACATAVDLAERSERKVAIISTDPAHSLSDVLGAKIGSGLTSVFPGLDAIEIDAEAEFDELRREYVEEVSAFFDRVGGRNVDVVYDRAVLEGLMAFAPPGIDEAMGLLKAMELLDTEELSTIVVDTAPTGHFLRLLEMPDLLQDWIRAIFRILQKYKTFVRLPRLADRLVSLSRQLRRFRALLTDSKEAAIYVVGHLSQLSWDEITSIADRCRQTGLAMSGIVLNRLGSEGHDGPTVDDFRIGFDGMPVSSIEEGRAPRGVVDLRNLGSALFARESA